MTECDRLGMRQQFRVESIESGGRKDEEAETFGKIRSVRTAVPREKRIVVVELARVGKFFLLIFADE
jgi:hypothetical protein